MAARVEQGRRAGEGMGLTANEEAEAQLLQPPCIQPHMAERDCQITRRCRASAFLIAAPEIARSKVTNKPPWRTASPSK